MATYLHATTELDGVTFASRHGADLALRAVFERAKDPVLSRTLDAIQHHSLSPEHADLQEALRILRAQLAEHLTADPTTRHSSDTPEVGVADLVVSDLEIQRAPKPQR